MTTPRVSNCYKQRFKRKARKFNKPRPLSPHLIPLIGDKTHVLILDAGSGPFTTLGAEVDDIFVDIVACDILADEYIAMMEARDILPWNLVEQENMECLSYGDGIFDIVHCQNALDHTENPREALKEMLRVCKRDGWIYLKHYPNVGDRHNYTGSHHWNLCVFEGDCKVWNREEEFLMSEILEDVAVFMDKGMVVCNWTK